MTGPDGRPIPAQTDCLTTWRKDGRHVKWLLVDVQAGGRTEPGGALSIEYPCAADPHPADTGPRIRVAESDDLLSIDTGALRIDFRRSFEAGRPPAAPAVISRCRVKADDGWHDVLRGDGPVVYLQDAHGTRYDSLSSGFAPEVVLEEAGPLRACVLIKGFLASAAGIRFCPYQLRVHLYAGMADVRIFHTFVFDQDPKRVELSAVGVDLPLALGERLRAAAGSDGAAAHWCEHWETMDVLQDDDRRYRVLRDGQPFGAGTRMPGWVSLAGSRASATVAVRDAWQEFPKGFTLSDRGIDVGIWPEACGRTLAFSTPYEETAVRFAGMEKSSATRSEAEVIDILARHPTAPLNLKSFNIRSLEEARWVEEMVEKHAPGRTISYNDTNTQNGVGAAKTTEIVIRFSAEPVGDEAAQAILRRRPGTAPRRGGSGAPVRQRRGGPLPPRRRPAHGRARCRPGRLLRADRGRSGRALPPVRHDALRQHGLRPLLGGGLGVPALQGLGPREGAPLRRPLQQRGERPDHGRVGPVPQDR